MGKKAGMELAKSALMILTSDWHLTDNPDDDYRWDVFKILENAMVTHGSREIMILGDLCDRKDRHSGVLVNRLIFEFTKLIMVGGKITIIMGNHDRPMNGPAYWTFLNEHNNIEFFDKPFMRNHPQLGRKLFLPYSANPKVEWDDINFRSAHAIFMHQTVTGVRENGVTFTNDKMPDLPDIPIYSGDIHTPQRVGPVCYVGAPHPVKFGDDYQCRMLVLDELYHIKTRIDLDPPRKCIAEVSSIKQLDSLKLKAGDQVRIRWKLPIGELDRWEVDQETVAEWQAKSGVKISSLEPTIVMEAKTADQPAQIAEEPSAILKQFAEEEGITGPMLDYGLELIEKAKGT